MDGMRLAGAAGEGRALVLMRALQENGGDSLEEP